MIKFILIFLISFLFFSCKDSLPSGVVSQEKMQTILWDVLRADALSEQRVKSDSTKSAAVENAALLKTVFSIHHITEDDFKKSYNYYSAKPDVMKAMFDSISSQQARLSILQSSLPGKKLNRDSLTKKYE